MLSSRYLEYDVSVARAWIPRSYLETLLCRSNTLLDSIIETRHVVS